MISNLTTFSVIAVALAMSACSSEKESTIAAGGSGGSDEGAPSGAGAGGDSGASAADLYAPPDADCPVLEVPLLVPEVGPWLDGPDPGPCTATGSAGTTTYEYDADGHLVSWEHSTAGSTTTTYDDQGRMATVTGPDSTVSLSYREDSVVVTTAPSVNETPAEIVIYELDATGRPVVGRLDRNLDDLPGWILNYGYDGCQLVRRGVEPGPSALDRGSEPPTLTYTYDDAGRLTERAADDGGSAVQFDYSCWAD